MFFIKLNSRSNQDTDANSNYADANAKARPYTIEEEMALSSISLFDQDKKFISTVYSPSSILCTPKNWKKVCTILERTQNRAFTDRIYYSTGPENGVHKIE